MYLRFCKKNSDRRMAANLSRRREAVAEAQEERELAVHRKTLRQMASATGKRLQAAKELGMTQFT